MSIWQPFDALENRNLMSTPSEDVEWFRSPGGKLWYRWRGKDEAAELRVLWREHHPTHERLIASHQPATQTLKDSP